MSEDLAELRTKMLEAHRRLCEEYRCPIAYFGALAPLAELVSALLSHRTKNADSARAFRTLRETLPIWEAVRDADVSNVQALIAASTWPEQKAPRLQSVLREITTKRGALELGFLSEMDVRAARDSRNAAARRLACAADLRQSRNFHAAWAEVLLFQQSRVSALRGFRPVPDRPNAHCDLAMSTVEFRVPACGRILSFFH
jgi:hypothetical protein